MKDSGLLLVKLGSSQKCWFPVHVNKLSAFKALNSGSDKKISKISLQVIIIIIEYVTVVVFKFVMFDLIGNP